MSLIIATSRLNEDETQTTNQRPSNFQNFFRSPIEIEADSEIAVDSVKIQRTGNITVGAKGFFCHYFGTDPTLFADGEEYNELLSISRTIKPKKGTYNVEAYARELTTAFNNQYEDPRIYGNASVTVNADAAFREEGVVIKFTDRGKVTTDVTASLTGTPAFNLANPSAALNVPFTLANKIAPSDSFSWTAGTGVLLRTGADAANLQNASCVAVLSGRPFSLNQGYFDVSLTSASSKPFAVGLTRPQIQYESPENYALTNVPLAEQTGTLIERRLGRIRDIDHYKTQRENGDTWIRTYNGAGAEIAGTHEMYDYVFIQDENNNITIAQRVYDSAYEEFVHQELEYWQSGGSATGAKMTKATFYATWDGIRFEGLGDQINLYFKRTGVSVWDQVIGSNLSSAGAVGRTFTPIGSTSYALYPMINLGAGSVTVTKFVSNYSGTDNSYDYPQFIEGVGSAAGYYPGDDMFSNEAVFGVAAEPYIKIPSTRVLASNSVQDAIVKCDSSYNKYDNVSGAQYSPYIFVGENAAGGVDYTHILTMNKFDAEDEVLDTLLAGQEYPNMSGRLGFPDRAIVNSKSGVGYVAGDDSKVVTFTSVFPLEKTALSSFIRLPGLTHKSFNGAQAGLSKIIYQVPQFSNDGREFGALYFEPGEKTYIKLNNPNAMILNSLQVQIVDAFEKETNSLTGDTQIVFHIRKRK